MGKGIERLRVFHMIFKQALHQAHNGGPVFFARQKAGDHPQFLLEFTPGIGQDNFEMGQRLGNLAPAQAHYREHLPGVRISRIDFGPEFGRGRGRGVIADIDGNAQGPFDHLRITGFMRERQIVIDRHIGPAALAGEFGEQQPEQDILAQRDIGSRRRGPFGPHGRRGRFRGLVRLRLNRGRRCTVFIEAGRRGRGGAGGNKQNRQYGRQITE